MWVGGWRNVAMGGRLNLPGESQRRLQTDGSISLSETWSFHLLNMGIGQEWLLALAFCYSHSLFLHRFVTKDSSFPYVENYMCVTRMFPGHSGPEHTLHGCLQRPLLSSHRVMLAQGSGGSPSLTRLPHYFLSLDAFPNKILTCLISCWCLLLKRTWTYTVPFLFLGLGRRLCSAMSFLFCNWFIQQPRP